MRVTPISQIAIPELETHVLFIRFIKNLMICDYQ